MANNPNVPRETVGEKPRLYETKFSFGATSGIITTLALIVGLDHWDNAKASIIGGIVLIALADNVSDSIGIHVYQESECLNQKEVWFSTLTNFLTRVLVSMSFIVPLLIFPLKTAVVLAVLWGLLLLSALTYIITRDQRKNPWLAIVEHLAIAAAVILASSFLGKWIGKYF
jgi:VIT1/CCC1 family predicted Fe2+/Mn2+ transporter